MIGIATNRCQGRVETDVIEIVETRGKAVLGKHRDAGHEHEADVFLSTLQDAVDFSGAIPVRFSLLVIFQYIQHRLVMFIDQYHCLLTGRLVQAGQNTPKRLGESVTGGKDSRSNTNMVSCNWSSMFFSRDPGVLTVPSRVRRTTGCLTDRPSADECPDLETGAHCPRTVPARYRPADSCRNGTDVRGSRNHPR